MAQMDDYFLDGKQQVHFSTQLTQMILTFIASINTAS